VKLLCGELQKRFSSVPQLAQIFPHCPAASGKSIESLITYVTDRAGHDFRYAIDAGKLHRELGFLPAEKFAAGLVKTIDWYIAHDEWWRSAQAGSQ